jgi:hypothetical protein
MTRTGRALAVMLAAGLAAAPVAAEGKRARASRHHGAGLVVPHDGGGGLSSSQSRTHYGTSGQTVGTVTAPSIGTYTWPSVGVTNAVPTWSNTNPPIR